MAGHSHSANIKFRKDRVDQARAKVFSKLARMVTVAAKLGGGDPDGNPRLRLAIDKARLVNMTKDSIARAIKKGTGEGSEGNYEELLYEGYGPGGVAVMLDVLTDNRNRTAPEVRKIFEKSGGKLAANGSVAWMFERRGVFEVDVRGGIGEDRLMEVVLEAGADDLVSVGDSFEIRCEPDQFSAIKTALEDAKVPLAGGEVAYVAKNHADIADPELARKVLKLLDALDEQDDVQGVYANYQFSDGLAEDLAKP
jgi:YebC/PmpR family DNA-binding regulatory protein